MYYPDIVSDDSEEPRALFYVDEIEKDYDTCMAYIKEDGMNLMHVYKAMITAEMCKTAMANDSGAWGYIPSKFFKDDEFALYFLNNHPGLFRWVVDDVSDKVMLLAFSEGVIEFKLLPKSVKTKELYLKHFIEGDITFSSIPTDMRPIDVTVDCVKRDGMILRHYEDQSEEIAMVAVRQNPKSLQFVVNKTAELCRQAVECCGDTIQWVPHELRTEDLCVLAVTGHCNSIHVLSDEDKTHRVCLTAVKENIWGIKAIPKHMMTKKVIMTAAEKNPDSIRFVPEGLLDEEIVLAAVSADGSLLEYISEQLQSASVCLAALYNDPSCQQYIKNIARFIVESKVRE